MQKMTVAEAAQELNMTVITVRLLLQKEKLPIGYAVKKDDAENYHYIIFRELVEGYKNRIEQQGIM